MKKLLLLSLITYSTLGFSQTSSTQKESEKLQSKAELFSERSGTLVQRQHIDIGDISTGTIKVAIYTDLISNQKTSAVRFEKEYVSSYSSDTKIALLDSDELDALIKSLNIIQEKVYNTMPENYTEVTFNSRSGFSAGCFYNKNKWSPFIKLEKYDSNSYVWLKKEDTQKLIDLLTTAKQKLI